jgi:single-stranded-DNA-specific exonuclease
MEIKNLKKVARRIKKAIRNNERIILYGDADLDGVASLIILKESIRNLGGEVAMIYFPDREKEGYGINDKALNLLKKITPALLILLDCGISNFQEVKVAKKLGFEIIIIDHHEILDKLPEAEIIVDPKQKGDKYPFKGLATAGIVFKLAAVLLGKNFSGNLKKSFLELVAIATVADMMPQVNENKIFAEEGLAALEKTFRPGLKVFGELNATRDRDHSFSKREISQKIISALNSSETKEHLTASYLLLTSVDKKTAKILAEDLLEKSYQRQLRIREIIDEVEERISAPHHFLKKSGGGVAEPLIFEGSDRWGVTLLGPVASRICQKYQKPVFIFKKDKTESQGGVRSPVGVDSVALLKKCQKYLLTYGGHPQASGFRIKNENLEKFKHCLIKNYTN